MTKKERIARVYARASEMGLSLQDTTQLLRIQKTLHRWYELECGTEGHGGSTHSIERDEKTDKPMYRIQFATPTDGWHDRRHPIADREKGAKRRLGAIMRAHWNLRQYVQTDPRGCALYILRAEDIREGENIESVYTRGLAMCV